MNPVIMLKYMLFCISTCLISKEVSLNFELILKVNMSTGSAPLWLVARLLSERFLKRNSLVSRIHLVGAY